MEEKLYTISPMQLTPAPTLQLLGRTFSLYQSQKNVDQSPSATFSKVIVNLSLNQISLTIYLGFQLPAF
jgi:hypothetical protein